MKTSVRQSTRTEREAQAEREPTVEDLLALLDAEYTREILTAIRAEPKSARAIAQECGASRPTVYRRLNALKDAGFVASEMAYDADGHHRTVFEATVETLSVDVTAEGFSVTVTTDERDSATTRPPERGSSRLP